MVLTKFVIFDTGRLLSRNYCPTEIQTIINQTLGIHQKVETVNTDYV
jgi:hypothetical protein